MRPYVIHLDWKDFTTAMSGMLVYVQPYSSTQRQHGVVHGYTSMLVASYTDHHDVIHAARVRIEFVDIFPTQRVPDAVYQRTGTAVVAMQRAITQAGAAVAFGLLLTPGLRDDLEHYETGHALWTWTGDLKDTQARQLIPAEDAA